MESKLRTYEILLELKKSIHESVYFDTAISHHYTLISTEFHKRKLFYKYIFSNGRFLICTIIASVFYSRDNAFLSDVSQDCLKTGMVSPNTVSSLLTLFKVSGRMTVINSREDRRKKKYVMTNKGEHDILTLLNTMAPCLKDLFPDSNTPIYVEKNHLQSFFEEYNKIHNSSIFLINLVKDSNVFISKDSGHMILLSLYLTCEYNKKDYTLSSISKTCGVSRTHLKSIIIEAENQDLLLFNQSLGKITLNDNFIFLFKEYMSYYFAFVQYGLEGIKKK